MLSSVYYVPPQVREAMQVNFKAAFRPIEECPYQPEFLGNYVNHYFVQVSETASFHIIKFIDKKLEEEREKGNKKPLKILELGCGKGAFVKYINDKYKGEVIATGITAYSPDQKDPAIKEGNIELLFTVNGVNRNEYDIVISHSTLMYVANPALCILNACDALKTRGTLLTDCIPLWGLTFTEHQKVTETMASKYALQFKPVPLILPNTGVYCIAGICYVKNEGVKFRLPLDYAGVYIEPRTNTPRIKYKYNPKNGNINICSDDFQSREEKSFFGFGLPVVTRKELEMIHASGSGNALEKAFLYFFKPKETKMESEIMVQAQEMERYLEKTKDAKRM